MKLLILGGTGWLGGHVAGQAVTAGHEVTCVARGAEAPAGATLARADRDRDDALADLATQRWDAVVDVATQPGHVRRASRDLAGSAERYVYVSSVSAYSSQAEAGADESAALFEPLPGDAMSTMADYGAAKAACEEAVRTAFADRSAIVRPGLIGGPGDRSGRTSYWPSRFAHPSNREGRVLVPDAPAVPTSVIDVRDLAAFLLLLAGSDEWGAFNATGDPVPFPEHIALARQVAGEVGSPVAAPGEWLLAHDVAEWAGPRSLPLWLHDPEWYGMNLRSNSRARSAGLALRPLHETLRDALSDIVVRGAGLTDDEERELLAALAERQQG